MGMSLLALAGLLRLWQKKTIPSSSPFGAFWTGWFCVATFSFLNCFWRNPGYRTAITVAWLPYVFFLIANCFLVFSFGFRLGQDVVLKKKIIKVLFFVSFIASLYGLLQYFGIEPLWSHDIKNFEGRLTSTFGNPAFLGTFLILVIPLNIACLFTIRGKPKRVGLIVLLFLLVATLMATAARSAWVGCVVAILSLIFFSVRAGFARKGTIMILVASIVCGSIVLLFSQKKSLVLRRSSWNTIMQSASVKQRVLIWSCATEMFIQHPFLGQGAGLFELFYPSYQGKYLLSAEVAPLKTHANHAHNEVLHILAELGLAGFVLGIYFLNVFFRQGKKVIFSSLSKEDKGIACGFLAGLIGVIVDSLFNVSLHIVAPALFFWLSVGLLSSYQGAPPEHKIRPAVLQKGILLLGILLCIILPLATLSHFLGELYFFKGTTLLAQADRAPYGREPLLNEGIRKLTQAVRVSPWDHETAYELAGGYLRQRDFESAVHWYRRAAELNISFDEIYYLLGVTEFALGNFQPAEDALRRAQTMHPQSDLVKGMLHKLQEAKRKP